jgi:hypothetical protein
VIREALLVMGQGGSQDIFNCLFVKVNWDFCVEDLEKEIKTSRDRVVDTGVKGVVAAIVIIFVNVQAGDGFVGPIICVGGIVRFFFGATVSVSHGKVDANIVGGVIIGDVDFKGFKILGGFRDKGRRWWWARGGFCGRGFMAES